MFIEKYQPYTYLLIMYDGGEVSENNPLPLPSIIAGEYKVNLDAIGFDEVDERQSLPFTRNDITWWLLDSTNGVLTKEIDLDDGAGTKFTIDDSGTLSIISVYFEAPENTHIEVVCVLGKPNSLNASEFDQTIPNGYAALPFTSGGGGGGGGGNQYVYNPITFHFMYDDTQSGSDTKNPIIINFVKAKYDATTNTFQPKTDDWELHHADADGYTENIVQGSFITMYAKPSTSNNWDISFVNTSTYSSYLTLIDEYNATINLGVTRVYVYEVNNVGEIQNIIDITMHSKEESPIT